MTHKRKTIRDNVVAQLVAASITGVGSSVSGNRLTPIEDSDLPVIVVYTKSEESEPMTADNSTSRMRRELDLIVEAVALNTDGDALDDTLDALSESIESAMSGDRYFTAAAVDSWLQSTEIETETDGEVPIGKLRLNYLVKYTG